MPDDSRGGLDIPQLHICTHFWRIEELIRADCEQVFEQLHGDTMGY
jgi:hypothetical protein